MLSNIECLLIRACKTQNKKRLISVYKRFYYRWGTVEEDKVALVQILSSLVDKVCVVRTLEVFKELDPKHIKHWANKILQYNEPYDYNTECYNFLVNKLRHLEHKQLVELGYRVPRRFIPVDFKNTTISNSYLAAEDLRNKLREIKLNETWIVQGGVDIQCFDYEVSSVLRIINLLRDNLDYTTITLTVKTKKIFTKIESSKKELVRKEGKPISIEE